MERDALTGLLSRRVWHEALERELARADAEASPLPTLALLDVDDMGGFNAAYGVDAGDDALTRIAEALKAVSTREDYAARVGGEEFALLATRSPLRAHAQIIRLRRSLPERPTVSLGTATFHRGETPTEFFLRAERELEETKRHPRGEE